MNITVSTEPLRAALALATSVADKRSTVPALACALLRADGKTVTVAASDLTISYVTTLECSVKEPGAIALEARGLHDIVNSLTGDEVTIRSVDGKGEIRSGKSRFQLGSQLPDDFPNMPDISALQFTDVDGQAFAKMCNTVVFAVSPDNTRTVLSGVFVDFREPMAIATDGHRGAIMSMPIGAKLEKHILIPRAGVMTLCRVIGDAKEVAISIGYDVLYLRVGQTVLAVKLLAEDFTSHASIIKQTARPKSDHEVVAPRDSLIDAVKRVSLASDKDLPSMRMAFVKNLMSLSSRSAASISEDEIAVGYDGKGIECGCNSRYLVEALESFGDEELTLGVHDPLDPIVIRPTAEDMGVEHTVIVMPLRLDQEAR